MNGRRRLSSDIISTLPQHIIDNILTLMPIHDALRTSILSSKWRYCWTTIPKLVFDEKLWEDETYVEHEFIDTIFHVLLLHRGPVLEFKVSVDNADMISKFDLIIHLLSKSNDLKTLNIEISRSSYKYKLPSSLFSFQGLEELILKNCDFKPPLNFNGLSRLRKVWFKDVKALPKIIQAFLSNCPLLEAVTLEVNVRVQFSMKNNDYVADLADRYTSSFVEFFPCVPLIEYLDLSGYYVKYMAAGGLPHKLPTSLVHLKFLYLDVCLMEQDEISSALCIIRNSPNLEDILILMYDNHKLPVRQTSDEFLDPQDYSDLNLDHLEKFEIQGFCNLPLETKLVKLIMAKSPLLKRARIELKDSVSVLEEMKILREFLQLPFPRAPTANLIIERPASLS